MELSFLDPGWHAPANGRHEVTALTSDQIEQHKRALQRLVVRLRAEVSEERAQEANQRFRDLAGEVTDSVDEATAEEIGGLDHEMMRRHMEALRDAEAALQRIAEGRFGICADCGVGIEQKRLEAYPTATRCGECQRARESNGQSW